MRRVIVVILLILAAYNGYQLVTGDEPSDASGSLEEANASPSRSEPRLWNGTRAPTSLTYTDCYEHFAFFEVPASAYEDRLPEGFALAPYVDDPTGQTATLVVYGQDCRLAGSREASRATTLLPVEPPEVFEHPDEEAGHALVLSAISDVERVTRVNEAWGFADVAGTGKVELDRTQTPTARSGTLEARVGEAHLEMQTGAEGPARELDGGLSRQFALGENGTVTGARDVNWTAFQYVEGQARLTGTPAAGLPEDGAVPPGIGGHAWAFEQKQSYVELPTRETGDASQTTTGEDAVHPPVGHGVR